MNDFDKSLSNLLSQSQFRTIASAQHLHQGKHNLNIIMTK